MSLPAFNIMSRCPSASVLFIALAAVIGSAASASVALAQPSPPEAAGPAAAARESAAQPAQQDSGASESSEEKSATETAAPTDGSAAPASENAANSNETTKSEEVPAHDAATEPKAADKAEGSREGGAPSAHADADRTDASKEAPRALTESPAEPTSTPASMEAAAAPAKPQPANATELKKLTVATWSGAYGEAQRDVVISGFKTKQSVAVRVIERNGKDPIDLATDIDEALPDAAEFSGDEIDAGCKSGQLVKLADEGGSIVAPAASSDFLPGSLKPCGIGAFAWSHVFAVNPDTFKKDKPQTLADVFDTKRFSGKRAFIKDPRFLLEATLMADGAKPSEVYDLLGSEEGLHRAFAKLDSIRDDILWVDDAKAAMSAVAKGEAGLGQSFSGRAFFAAARGTPVDIIWDGQIYSMTYWAIPAKSPRRALAREFLDFAIQPQQLAAVAQRFPYGPTRTSALALAKRHLAADLELDEFLPTAPDNMKTALSTDETWWAENRETIATAFAEWMDKPPEAPAKAE